MACVLTVAVVNPGTAVVGHVGDTRLFALRDGRIDKITRDHSPVGEREDAGELTEAEAMRHPRRNEVYRDVGSEAHAPDDPGFIDTYEIPFESDAALLLCSDGLSDLVDSASIKQLVHQHATDPAGAVRALIAAANAAGGRDNVTAVIVEGPRFAATVAMSDGPTRATRPRPHRVVDMLLGGVLTVLAAAAILALDLIYPLLPLFPQTVDTAQLLTAPAIVVRPGESIAAALTRADVGSTVIVEPGDYPQAFALVSGVRLISRVPRGATIRLPADVVDSTAVTADGISGAEFVGFRIAGETPARLGTGVRLANAEVSLIDLEVTGATSVGIDIGEQARVNIVGCDLHDNNGVALAIRPGTSPRIAHSTFTRNGGASRGLLIDGPSDPQFIGNVFRGINVEVFSALGVSARAALVRANWFQDGQPAGVAPAAGARGRPGRE
jgi:hypothetical protein